MRVQLTVLNAVRLHNAGVMMGGAVVGAGVTLFASAFGIAASVGDGLHDIALGVGGGVSDLAAGTAAAAGRGWDDATGNSNGAEVSEGGGVWACARCTFEQPADNRNCEVCMALNVAGQRRAAAEAAANQSARREAGLEAEARARRPTVMGGVGKIGRGAGKGLVRLATGTIVGGAAFAVGAGMAAYGGVRAVSEGVSELMHREDEEEGGAGGGGGGGGGLSDPHSTGRRLGSDGAAVATDNRRWWERDW